jgi:hypothetical protein
MALQRAVNRLNVASFARWISIWFASSADDDNTVTLSGRTSIKPPLTAKQAHVDFKRAEMALQRAVNRLNVSDMK